MFPKLESVVVSELRKPIDIIPAEVADVMFAKTSTLAAYTRYVLYKAAN